LGAKVESSQFPATVDGEDNGYRLL